jgi:hypothetical protein
MVGVGNAAISHPQDPKKLALSLLSGISGQSNYALELDPFFFGYQNLSASAYVNPDWYQMIWRNLSFSLTKAPISDTVTATTGTAIGLGVRTLLNYYSSGTINAALAKMNSLQVANDADLQNYIDKKDMGSSDRTLNDALKDTTDFLSKESPLVSFEPAGGIEVDYPTDDVNYAVVSKAGGWLTADVNPADLWQESEVKADLIGVWRYIYMRELGQGYQDSGGRIRISWDSYAFSYECVSRALDHAPATGSQYSTRSVGIGEYYINSDTAVTFTFGKDNAVPGSSAMPLVAIMGANVSFGQPSIALNTVSGTANSN